MQGMEYSALRLETLALHVLLKARLATDNLSPTAKMEVAAWKQLEGSYRVVEVNLQDQTIQGGEATDDQFDFASTRSYGYRPEEQSGIIRIKSYSSPQCDCSDCNASENVFLNVADGDGVIFFDILLSDGSSYTDNNFDLPSLLCTTLTS